LHVINSSKGKTHRPRILTVWESTNDPRAYIATIFQIKRHFQRGGKCGNKTVNLMMQTQNVTLTFTDKPYLSRSTEPGGKAKQPGGTPPEPC